MIQTLRQFINDYSSKQYCRFLFSIADKEYACVDVEHFLRTYSKDFEYILDEYAADAYEQIPYQKLSSVEPDMPIYRIILVLIKSTVQPIHGSTIEYDFLYNISEINNETEAFRYEIN